MHIAARLAIHSLAPDRRRKTRFSVDSPAIMSGLGLGFDGADVIVKDISETGFSARAGHHLPPGTLVRLKVPGFGMAIGKIVWSRRGDVGGEFVNPVGPARLRTIVGYKPDARELVAA
jgi:PilZ domain